MKALRLFPDDEVLTEALAAARRLPVGTDDPTVFRRLAAATGGACP